MRKVKISALGCYTPQRVLNNFDLEKLVDTNNQWILERTGISERRIADPGTATSDLAVEAAKQALAQRKLAPEDLDAILVCTVTPDMLFPSTACLVQKRLGATHAWGFDLVAACSGFLYGLTMVESMIRTEQIKYALVIGAEILTKYVDYTDRSTCVIFGDGAGAAVVGPVPEGKGGDLRILRCV